MDSNKTNNVIDFAKASQIRRKRLSVKKVAQSKSFHHGIRIQRLRQNHRNTELWRWVNILFFSGDFLLCPGALPTSYFLTFI